MAKLRFRMKQKIGTHYLRDDDGKVTKVRPGDVITCEKYKIKVALDKFEQLDPDPPPAEPKLGLKMVHKGGKYWDVINEATGKKVNEQSLTKEEASEICRTGIPEDKEEEEKKEEGEVTTTDGQMKRNLSLRKAKKDQYHVIDNDTGNQMTAEPMSLEEAKKFIVDAGGKV